MSRDAGLLSKKPTSGGMLSGNSLAAVFLQVFMGVRLQCSVYDSDYYRLTSSRGARNNEAKVTQIGA